MSNEPNSSNTPVPLGLLIIGHWIESLKGSPNPTPLSSALKPELFPWMYEVSSKVLEGALKDLECAFKNFFRKCKEKKQGKFKGNPGYPQPKTKRKGIGSFRLRGTIKVTAKTVQLPRLGKLRLKERGYIPVDAKVLSATVSERAGHWFVSIQVEEERPEPPEKVKAIVGVDLGIKTLAVCSDGKTYENFRALRRNLRKRKRLQRLLSRKQKGGQNRRKARERLARFDYHIANIRKDCLHKITTDLTKSKSLIVIEDLSVSGMMKNHCLAQAIADLGLFEFRRQLEYKGKLYGCGIQVADRFFPSSKLCRFCGRINKELTLADRTWTCACGAIHDRDFNASVNLEKLAASSAEAGSDQDRKPASVKQEVSFEPDGTGNQLGRPTASSAGC